MCEMSEENFYHFMSCQAYGKNPLTVCWKQMFENDPEEQNNIALEVKRRQSIRRLSDGFAIYPPQTGLPQDPTHQSSSLILHNATT